MNLEHLKPFKNQAARIEAALENMPKSGTPEFEELVKDLISFFSDFNEAHTFLKLWSYLTKEQEILVRIHGAIGGLRVISWLNPPDAMEEVSPKSKLMWNKLVWPYLFPNLSKVIGDSKRDYHQEKYEAICGEAKIWEEFIKNHSIVFPTRFLCKEIVDTRFLDAEAVSLLASYGPNWKNYELLEFKEFRTETRHVNVRLEEYKGAETIQTVIITRAIFVNSETGKEVTLSPAFIKEVSFRNWIEKGNTTRLGWVKNAIEAAFGAAPKS